MRRIVGYPMVFGATASRCLACLIVLAPVSEFVSAQAAPGRLLPPGPLEKQDNPPAYLFRRETSPRTLSRYGSFISYQVNVDANGRNIIGDAANEPSICVDPTDRNKMTIGWRQFDTVTSNFREAGWAYTTNGGVTWRFPGVLQNNVFRSDPVLQSDDLGRFFYLSLLGTFFDDLWRSLNSGQSWTRLQAQGGATGGDKPWFTIDNTNSIGHGFQYQAWSTDGNNFGGKQFSRSTDGGVTWMDPINIPHSPVWGTLDVDSNGNLFIGGVSNFTSPFWCVRSSNAKNGNVIPTFDRVTAVNMGGSIVSGAPINPDGLAGQLFLAVDRSGMSTNNNVYMLASVRPTGATNGTDVMFARSTDGGQSFSAPRRINDDPVNHNKWHWFGTLAVAPNGRIDAVWLDTRNAANNTNSQLFYSWSIDGGVTWAPNIAVSNSFDPFLGYPNQNKIGDYITIVSDAAGGNVAYTATFNGEQDIYYVRVAPPVTPRATVADFNGDGYPDYVLQNTSTHQTTLWYLNNNVYIGSATAPTLPAGWSLACAADFNLDTHPDYALFIATTSQTVIGYLSGPTIIGAALGPTLSPGWELAAAADFNNDSYPDYALYNASTSQTALWYLNNNVFVSADDGPTLPAGWSLIGVADFNGDTHPDFALFNARTGQTAIAYLSGPTVIGAALGPTIPGGWKLVAVADFNADAHPDYLLYKASTRQTAIAYLNDHTLIGAAYGPTLPAGWSLITQ
jgi:hypothetical protein